MKKRYVKLILLALVFVLLLGAYYLVTSLTKEDETTQDQDTTIVVSQIDTDNITGISYTKDDTTLSFNRINGLWSYSEDPDFPLTQNFLTTMSDTVKTISANRILDEAGELSSYGFDKPSLVLTVTTSENTKYVYTVGDYNSYVSSYYMLYNDKVYLVDSNLKDTFSKDLFDFLTAGSLPTIEEGTSVVINDNEITDKDAVKNFVESFGKLSLGDIVDYKNPEKYGFNGSETKVTINYTVDTPVTDESGNVTSNVKAGNSYSFSYAVVDGTYYIMLQDDDLIYKVTGAENLTTESDLSDETSTEVTE